MWQRLYVKNRQSNALIRVNPDYKHQVCSISTGSTLNVCSHSCFSSLISHLLVTLIHTLQVRSPNYKLLLILNYNQVSDPEPRPGTWTQKPASQFMLLCHWIKKKVKLCRCYWDDCLLWWRIWKDESQCLFFVYILMQIALKLKWSHNMCSVNCIHFPLLKDTRLLWVSRISVCRSSGWKHFKQKWKTCSFFIVLQRFVWDLIFNINSLDFSQVANFNL